MNFVEKMKKVTFRAPLPRAKNENRIQIIQRLERLERIERDKKSIFYGL